ncbi:hypothetical protein [Vibrio quintilis]|uniref:cyanobactin maturation protease PatG family protein n=1 Tax=Vibrio quintilis TaxID=1117707 RepID=UPI00351FF61D
MYVLSVFISNSDNESTMPPLVEEILSLNANDGNRNDERALNYVLYNNPQIYLQSYTLYYK